MRTSNPLACLAGLFLALVACNKESEAPVTPAEPLIVPEESTSPVFDSNGGTIKISFTANQAWSATFDHARAGDWLSISPISGKAGPATLSITTIANPTYDERNAAITLYCKESDAKKIVTVTQKQKDAILLSADKVEVNCFGENIRVDVKSNVDYTVRTDVDWISRIGTKGLKESSASFSVAENDTKERREGHIVFSCGNISETVTVYQAGNVPTILLTQSEYTIGADGGDLTVEIQSNVDVTVVLPEVEWITENANRSSSTQTYVFSIDRNEDYDNRTAQILFTNKENNLSEAVTVTQVQRDALLIAKDEYVFSNHEDILALKVQTNAEITTSVDVDWIEFLYVSTRAVKEAVVVFSIYENEQGDERSATITVTAGDAASQKIIVIQRSNDEQVASERAALMDFFNATGGPNWKNNYNWGSDLPVRDWYGISANPDGTVTSINLDENNLVGTIPDSFGVFTNLQTLILNRNHLSGNIPESFGNLTSLGNLLLLGNDLSGSIPESIGNLTEMRNLDLTGNKLTGSIPLGILNMSKLRYLYLGENELTGSIPQDIGNLSQLISIRLNDNHLSGDFPHSISKLKNLEYFTIDRNKELTGTLPDDIGNMTRLQKIYAQNCPKFGGPIPESICQLTNLEGFYCSFSHFTGPLPQNIGNLENLQDIRMCRNALSGSLPESIGRLKKLHTLMIRGNEDLTGNLPASMGDMTNLQYVYLEGNRLTGGIPDTFMNLSNLKFLDLSGNCMDGTVSAEMYQSDWWKQLVINIPQRRGYGLTIHGIYTSTDFSKDGEVKLLQSHSKGNGIKLIITGDGFSDRMIADGSFEGDARRAMEYFFEKEPYTSFRDYFDVYCINAVSYNEIIGLQTAFKTSAYDDKYDWDIGVVRQFITDVSQFGGNLVNVTALVLLNEESGATRVSCATDLSDAFSAGLCTLTDNMKYEINHEIGGHGFGKLADEYWDDDTMGSTFNDNEWLHDYHKEYGCYLNVDGVANPDEVLWKDFISNPDYAVERIGIYEGGMGYYTYGIYRPTENSIMRTSTDQYNAPSRWAIYQRIKKLAGEDCCFEGFLEYDKKNLAAIASATSSANFVERREARTLGLPPKILIRE